MLCPKCSKSLSPCSKTGAHRCPSCKGYWLEPLLLHLKDKSRITHKAINDIRDQEAQQQTQLKCPKDKTGLYAFFYDEVELDYCPKCRGLWFDANELEGFKKLNPIAPQKTKKDHGVDWTDRKTSMHHFFGSF